MKPSAFVLSLTAAALLMPATARAGRQQQAAPPETPPVLSANEKVELDTHRQPGSPTVFVFYNETSSADRKLVEDLTARRGRSGAAAAVGLVLIRLPNLDAPAAKQHDIKETPTVLVLDRFGKTLARTSQMEEIDQAVMTGLRMARIKWVDERDPKAAEVYKNFGGGRGRVPEIIKTMSLQPEWMNAVAALAGMAQFSDTHLPRRTKEMIATYVSGINRCKY